MLNKSLLAIPIFLLFSCKNEEVIIDTSIKENILKIIEAEKQIQGLHALSFCVVKENNVIWTDAIGNATDKVPATVNTRFFIASISKSVTAVAIMQMVEQGLLDLDADINNYLPFSVRNPNHPDAFITIRMLLNHSGSISDDFYYSFDFTCWNKDCDFPLEQFLEGFFSESGQFYSNKNFHPYKPGEKSNYTNLGYALLGFIVENVSQEPFDYYCKNHIFIPLRMTNTEWRLANVPTDELAYPYSPTFTPGKPYYTLPDYPAGGLITTPSEFSIFLRMLMNNGSFNGSQILKPQSILLMQQKTLPLVRGGLQFEFGLGMYYHSFQGKELYGHGGGDQGITTVMAYDIGTKTGVLVFNNSSLANLDLIVYSLYKFGTQQ